MYPILYEAAGIQIGTYGVCIVLGGAAAWFMTRLLVRRRGGRLFALDDMTYVFMMCIAGAFIGAFLFRPITRIPELIVNWQDFKDMPSGVIMNFLFGEIVFYGGLIGGAAAMVIFCRGFKISVLPVADIAAPAVALGHAFGRVGCYFGGCCYGIHVDALHPLAVRFPDFNAGGAPPGVPLLPVQLIEAACLLVISAILTAVFIKTNKEADTDVTPAGFTLSLYCLLYGILRFVLEFYRGDLIRGVYGLFSTSQYVSMVLIIAGAAGIVLCLKGTPGNPERAAKKTGETPR